MASRFGWRAAAFSLAFAAGCASGPRPMPEAPPAAPASTLSAGVASFYAHSLAGRRTANGEAYAPEALTCAHRTLPFGTELRVTSTATGRSVVVRVNDRGPYAKGRLVDLSERAARELGFLDAGTALVEVEVLRH